MKVLHVIDGIDVGGAEYVLVQLIEGLRSFGIDNSVLVMTTCGPLKERILASGSELIEVRADRGRIPIGAIQRMKGAFRAAAPDVVQGWMYHGNLAATVLNGLSRTRVPVFWSNHNTLEPRPEMPWLSWQAMRLTRILSGRPEVIVYVSQASARQHERAGFRAEKTRVIPNGTDCSRFRPRPESSRWLHDGLGIADDIPLVGLFARWHPMKGHSVLFSAVARLLKTGTRLHLVLAGTGLDRANPDLAAALAGAGLASHVSCLGERSDVHALLAALDAFVLPSVFGEAFPLVLGEAMATEVPCIATDVGDSRLILGNNGTIIAPGDVAALANAMRSLLETPRDARRDLGRKARLRVMSTFSVEKMVEQYARMYANAAARVANGGPPTLRQGA
jgi:glycosyltransferase involved in cell wall biosynthesis